jgi:hypothetical protein
MKYFVLFIILITILGYLHFLQKYLDSDKFTCPKVYKTLVHYFDKKTLENYYMNNTNFKQNMLHKLKTNLVKFYIKDDVHQNIRKNLDYFYSTNNFSEIEKDYNYKFLVNKHIEIVINALKTNRLDTKIKIKLFLTLLDVDYTNKNIYHIVFSPYKLTDKTAISIDNIIIIGLHDLDGNRSIFDYNQIRNCFTSGIKDFSLDEIEFDTKFSEDLVKNICSQELSVACKNNFKYINKSLEFYKDTQKELSNTMDVCAFKDQTNDTFSSQTNYLDSIDFSFY